ncbi:MAG: EF-P lysine aminoacylase GenX, partial [Woeseiaceae bacterium]|nr:EF-P lysine aminoacylase GenX [Woeseiaceae bacterium]
MNDSSWRPRAGLPVARSRAAMLKRARKFFEVRNVLEVDTPILTRFPVTDPHIASLSASSSLQPELFLHTSPEYRMKQLLAAGFGDIYQIGKVFRDGERGASHLPEFTLVEWYRLDFGLKQIMRDTIEFLAATLDRPQLEATAAFKSYDNAFRETVELDPREADASQLARCVDAGADLQRAIGDDRDAWLDLVLAERIVSDFATDRFTVIFHYPKSQAALARTCPDDTNCADRFEVFYGNLELANGFVELTDADEQLARFERDQQTR